MINSINKSLNYRKRMLNMSINALIGYIIVGSIACIARALELSTIKYVDILILSLVVNIGTILFILFLRRVGNVTERMASIIFFLEFALYISMYSIAVIKLEEFRTIALIFALVAITIELPFTDYIESLMISISSALSQILMSYYAIYYLAQGGSFIHEVFYTFCFLPALIIMAYVARQINIQKEKIISGRVLLEDMNKRIINYNKALEKVNESAGYEIDFAAQVQRAFLPALPEKIDGWDIALDFRPKYGVSGDFYDFYFDKEKLTGMTLFDVSGHGVSSALLTMIVKPIIFRYYSRMTKSGLNDVLLAVDDSISNEISGLDSYLSCVLLRFSEDNIEYINAGHPELIMKKASSGAAEIIEIEGRNYRGTPLGVNLFKNTAEELRFKINPGDAMIVYTDCLLESKNRYLESFGKNRLMSAIEDAPFGNSEEILKFILERFESHIDEAEIKDDFTLIVMMKKQPVSD
jgi:sigma-B regulation protein RsbU (phosphoserine phosphatase)